MLFKGTKVCSEFKTGLGKVEDKYSTADGVYVNIMKTTFLFNFFIPSKRFLNYKITSKQREVANWLFFVHMFIEKYVDNWYYS